MIENEITRRAAIGSLSAGVAAAAFDAPAAATEDGEAMQSFELTDLIKQMDETGKAYRGFLDVPTLSAGIYRLAKGSTDGQSPHGLDEVYYVIEGRAKFEAEGETIDVKPGGVIFVKAKAGHRFLDIEEDLVLLVQFSKKQPA